ncbi:hypothetical protein F5X68DRAFT_24476 [Plectosphaerella plurivora]|uniref:Uncharacterized protein n=1 Tax=Plectosphaerella plurivora TaxID=936078 RepID=A0A9P9AAC1_9PEZI|nr:hypothetical protein F5X68DRAFT_24476 [Plectosphaerella plurivora]
MKLRFKVQTAPSVEQPPARSRPSTLAFVHVDRPDQINTVAAQRKIRRHVMKDIGRARRMGGVVVVPRAVPTYWGDLRVCGNFRRLFWAMDAVSDGLLALAAAEAHEWRARLETGLAREQYELEQYTESLGLVRRSFVAEDRASRHAVIGTIICLAMFDMRAGNQERWEMHMKGLARIIQLSGGIETLEACPPIRQSLFIADVLGSLVNDAPPRFRSMPTSLPPRSMASASRKFRSTSPLDNAAILVIDGALDAATQLATLLNRTWDAQKLTLDLLLPVTAITHTVLSLPRPMQFNTSPLCAAAELVRMSVLAMLSTVITTTSGDTFYCEERRRKHAGELLVQSGAVWACAELRLWVLVIQALVEPGPRNWLLDEITSTMVSLSLRSWDDLMGTLQQVVWVDRAAMEEMEQLREDIEARSKDTR